MTEWVNPPPTVTGSSVSIHSTSQLVTLASYFTASNADGTAPTQYRFIDSSHSGQIVLSDPNANLATNEEAAQGIYRVVASNLSDVQWRLLPGTGTIAVAAFDGVQWSNAAVVTIGGQNNAPIVTPVARQAFAVGQPVSISSLFSLSDPDHFVGIVPSRVEIRSAGVTV